MNISNQQSDEIDAPTIFTLLEEYKQFVEDNEQLSATNLFSHNHQTFNLIEEYTANKEEEFSESNSNALPKKSVENILNLITTVKENYQLLNNTISADEYSGIRSHIEKNLDLDDFQLYSGSVTAIKNYFSNPNRVFEFTHDSGYWAIYFLVFCDNSQYYEILNQVLYYLHAQNNSDMIYRINSALPGWISNFEHFKYTDETQTSYFSIDTQPNRDSLLSITKSLLENPYLSDLDLHSNDDDFFKVHFDKHNEEFLLYLINDYGLSLTYGIEELLLTNNRIDLIELFKKNNKNSDNLESLESSSYYIDNTEHNEDDDEDEDINIFVALDNNTNDKSLSVSPESVSKSEEEDPNLITWLSYTNFKDLDKQSKESSIANPEKKEQLKNILSNLVRKKPILVVEDYSVFNTVLDKAPNFTEVIKYFKGSFILNQSRRELEKCYLVPTPILLLGDPGIGKTYFAKILAQALNTSFYFMDANSISASWILTGSSGQWRNSDCGNIFKYMKSSKTVSPLVIFDEIDKLSLGKNYDTFSVFHQLLEPENSRTLLDEFLNISFDASNIVYILTANNINDIPESLLSRMKIFDIKAPDITATRKIAQHLYTDLIGKSPLFNPLLTENALKFLENLVPRNLKKVLTESVFNQASDLNGETGQDLIIKTELKEQKWGF